jgi:hypothetical protein
MRRPPANIDREFSAGGLRVRSPQSPAYSPQFSGSKKARREDYASLGPNIQMGKTIRGGDVAEIALRPI